MRVYLGLTDTSLPQGAKLLADVDGKLVDASFAHAQSMSRSGDAKEPHKAAAPDFPETIAELVQRGAQLSEALETVLACARRSGIENLRGPAGERAVFDPSEVRILPPLENPERSIVIGFSDRARAEAVPVPEIPTGFYKLPQTFVTSGTPVAWPKFSQELDADACLALIIGKAGKRIDPAAAWDHIAGATLLIDITARDINRREGLTTNNLLGKNFPSSTCLGPAVLLYPSRRDLEALTVELTVDGEARQKFTLGDCVFTVEQMVARWSLIGLKPGDFLAIGASTARAGDRLQNPVGLKVGSELRCSSPAIGELAHRVIAAAGSHR